MRRAAIIAMLGAALFLVPPAAATGGQQTFRIVTTGDAYMIALSSSCPRPPDFYEPDLEPNPDLGGVPPTLGISLPGTCFVLKTNLGYDGLSGGSTCVAPGGDDATDICFAFPANHLGHDFACGVTQSATGASNSLPYPANMALADSLVVGFDLNGDGSADVSYGGRIQRYPIGAVINRVVEAAGTQDVPALLDTPTWYLGNFGLPGPTPFVTGNVDGFFLIIWNQGGSDVTVECSF